MKSKFKYLSLIAFVNISVFAQIPNLPTPQQPNPNSIFEQPKIGIQTTNKNIPAIPSSWNNPNASNIEKMNQQMMLNDFKQVEKEQRELSQRKILEKHGNDYTKTYSLASFSDNKETKAYYSAFENLSKFNPDNYSISDATFLVENAFYNNDKNFQNTYQNYIQKATKIIRSEITKKKIDDEDNASKNIEIFKYFHRTPNKTDELLTK